LLHRQEIERLEGRVKERGLTLVPLRLYFKNGRAKVELALARGKKQHDKREAIRDREQRREIDRALSDRRRGR
jgi:SsrA-binding protein